MHNILVQASSHPGHYMSQSEDQPGFMAPTGDHLANVPPTYDQILDISLQLSNLSTPNFNFVVRGEKLGLTGSNPVLGSGSSGRTPDSSLSGHLQIGSGSFGETLTLQGAHSLGDKQSLGPALGPNQNLQSPDIHTLRGVSVDLSRSSSELQKAKTEDAPGFQAQTQLDQKSHLHSVLQPQAQSRPDRTSGEEANTPFNIFYNAPKNPVSNSQGSVSTKPVSSATSQTAQNLDRLGSVERRTTEMVRARVQNVRVRPPSKFVSSGSHLNQKPYVQQTESENARLSQDATGPAAHESHRTQLQEQRASNMGQERVSALKQEQDVQRVGSDRIPLNQQILQNKLVQSVAETASDEGQVPASPRRNMQPAGRDESPDSSGFCSCLRFDKKLMFYPNCTQTLK